ncbi:MAG: hypothetical protein IJL20_12555 [Lachnospiraceae bacterium]|nr:hypothetical protein [Lachnospiraceae bacterium]
MRIKKKREETPLHELCNALCSDESAKIFRNQIDMFQTLIPFLSDQLTYGVKNYKPYNVDSLIEDIKRFLLLKYENMITGIRKDPEDNERNLYSCMHRYIINNIANRDTTRSNIYEKNKRSEDKYSIREMSFYSMDSSNLDAAFLKNNGQMGVNINHIIMNRRSLPKELKKVFQDNNEDYSILIYRCFWMLQYHCIYYGNENELKCYQISRNLNRNDFQTSRFIELFKINQTKAVAIYNSLQTHCRKYSHYFETGKNKISFLSLARVIVDVIIEQLNLQGRISLEKIKNTDMLENSMTKVTEAKQFEDYQNFLGGYGTDSYDRWCMLKKFAPINCYAAEEMASAYYWGKSYVIRSRKDFEVEQDYNKAIEWFIKAIEMSDPPMQTACWSLGSALLNRKYSSEEEYNEAEKKALAYFNMVRDYPAIDNAVAKLLFRDGDRMYSKWNGDPDIYEDILIKYLSAIRLADKAGQMHWFFGHNQIALFLKRHASDIRLLDDLSSRLELSVPFDIESQLTKSASYGNPWALKQLSVFMLEKGERDKAKELMEEAIEAKYDAAFYELAMRFYDRGSAEWVKYLKNASDLGFPRATYELMLEEKDKKRKDKFRKLCLQQAYAEKHLDIELIGKID